MRRSMTLLEIVIVLVLMVALGALVFPSIQDGLAERAFETAADATNQQLILARAHAQSTGEPVEVTYDSKTSQVNAKFYGSWRVPHVVAPQELQTTPQQGPSAGSSASSQDGKGDVITESWASRMLGHGVRIVLRSPEAAASPETTAAADETVKDVDAFHELRNGQEVRLAVFMPDGSALVGDPVWLNDNDGRWGKLSVNPFNGLPDFQRMTASAMDATETETADGASNDPVSSDQNFGERDRSPVPTENQNVAPPDDGNESGWKR